MLRYIITFVLLIGSSPAIESSHMCAPNCNTELLNQLERSLNTWIYTKNKNGNSYKYSVLFSSWSGLGSSSTIHILKDNIVKREYRYWDRKGNDIVQWLEDKPEDLGSHDDGAKLQTIEQLYEDCRLILLKKDDRDNDIHLAFDESGIIRQCQFTPKNCVDDCSSGININELIFNK